MMRRKGSVAVALCAIALGAGAPAVRAEHGQPMPTRTELANEAMDAYYENDPQQALELMWRAIELYPEDPAAHLNYASLAYQIARQLKMQGEDGGAWQKVGREAERELTAVMRLSPSILDRRSYRAIAGRAAFLLGDLHWHLRGDARLAEEFYRKSLHYAPGNNEAAKGLEALLRQTSAPQAAGPAPGDLGR
jgi:hypothetical protein